MFISWPLFFLLHLVPFCTVIYAIFSCNISLLVILYFISLFTVIEDIRENWNDSRSIKRDLVPSVRFNNIFSIILWPLERFVYILKFPISVYYFVKYTYFSEEPNYFKVITESSMIIWTTKTNVTDYKFFINNCMLFQNEGLVTIKIIFNRDNIKSFTVNDIEQTRKDYCGLLWYISSTITHPVLHSFQNRHEILNNGKFSYITSMYGQFLNGAAHILPSTTLQVSVDRAKQVLSYNGCKLHIPHHNLINLRKLGIKYVDDLLDCRRILKKFFVLNKMGTDFDSFFVSGMLHSIDHHNMFENLGKSRMEYKNKLVGFALYQFSNPHIFLISTRLTILRHFFKEFNELYHQLAMVNQNIADRCTLSLCM